MRTRFLFLFRSIVALLACLAMGAATPGWANDHGGGGGAPEPLKFTTNLGAQYLQIEMVLEGASPEAAQSIAAHKPKIQHQVILLLSDEEAGNLRTRKGKEELMEKIQAAVNKILDMTAKTGISEVFFTNFIIQ